MVHQSEHKSTRGPLSTSPVDWLTNCNWSTGWWWLTRVNCKYRTQSQSGSPRNEVEIDAIRIEWLMEWLWLSKQPSIITNWSSDIAYYALGLMLELGWPLNQTGCNQLAGRINMIQQQSQIEDPASFDMVDWSISWWLIIFDKWLSLIESIMTMVWWLDEVTVGSHQPTALSRWQAP